MTRYRAMMADGHLDPAERAELALALEALAEEVRQAQSVLDGMAAGQGGGAR